MADSYEFDAPSHVVDFKEPGVNEGDDKWFDRPSVGADGCLTTPGRSDWPFMLSDSPNLPRAIVIPQVKKDVDIGPDEVPSVSPPPPNIVTSWGHDTATQTDEQPRSTANQPLATPRRVSKRKGMTSGSTTALPPTAAPPFKKNRMSPISRPVKKSSGATRRGRKLISRTDLCRSGKLVSEAGAASSNTANAKLFSSEEQELEHIKNLQKEVTLQRKKNEACYKAALAGNPPPKKTAMSTTVPKEFNFNKEMRAIPSNSSHVAHKEVDFIHQLRKPSSPAKANRGATIPRPFKLSRGNKSKVDKLGAYVPMAQQIEQFEKRTPDRYHVRSRRIQERGPCPAKDEMKLTMPHTPHLMTSQRSRPTNVKSTAELETEEADKLHKFKFKALELNKKILENADDLKKPAVKEPTIPEGFKLQTEKRHNLKRASTKPQEEEKMHVFKSQPLPKRIFEGIVGLPERRVLDPTVPESPAFALNKRVRVDRKVEEVKLPSPIKAPPVPHYGLPFLPRPPENHHVEVCPFSFEEREREKKALKERRLEEKQTEEVPQFKAQPLPHFDTVLLPEKKKLEPTKPEPFRLLLNERGAVKTSRWEQMVKDEHKQQQEAATFKARPNTVTHKDPFQPKKGGRAAVAVEAFELSTERRAREWQEYDRIAVEKEALGALMEERQRQEEQQQEKEEIARLRQEQVHKAQPIRQYKPVAVKKSELPLTVPHSPNFSDRFRL